VSRKKIKFGFYVFGITYTQDLIPLLIKSLEKDIDSWFCFFDCVYKKRHFYYYSKDELINLIIEICKSHNFKIPKISFFGLEDEESFKQEYEIFQPDAVFLQVCTHKYAKWLPKADKSKVINLPFHFDVNEGDSFYNIDLNIVSKKEYIDSYKSYNFKTLFFGDIKLDHTNSIEIPVKNYAIEKDLNKKICFIPGTHLRYRGDGSYVMGASKTPDGPTSQGDSSKNYDSIKFVSRTLRYLKEKDYFILWKEREKGYPKGKSVGWDNVLNHIEEKPDLVIRKDLNYPSSLMYVPTFSDVTIVFNFSSVKYTISKITNRVINVDTNNDFFEEMKKIDSVLENKKEILIERSDVSERIVNYVLKELL